MRIALSLRRGLCAAFLALPICAQFQDFAGWTGFDIGTAKDIQFPNEFELADIDGDGHPDLIASSWGLSQHVLAVAKNLGDQTFAPASFYPLLKGSMDLVVADLDGDGDRDIAVTEGGNDGSGTSVAIFRNSGSGAFAFAQRVTVPKGPLGIAAGDFDGDGDRDLAIAIYGLVGSGNTIRVLLNNAGVFALGASAAVATGPSAIAAGDLDGDGRDDLAIGHEKTDTISILLASGAGFAPALSFNVKASTEPGAHLFPCVELVDLDRDGDLDIAFSDNTHQKLMPLLRGVVTVVRNQGGGSFALAPDIVLRPGAGGFTDMAFADLNGDQWPDVLGVDHMDWDYALSDGSGGFVQPSAISYGKLATNEPTAIAAFDADRDGDLDALVLGSHSLALSVHRFQSGALVEAPFAPGVDGEIDAADIDGDGDLDIAGGGGGPIGVLRNLGGGSFAPVVYYNSLAFGGPEAVLLRELDGDGFPDLVVGSLGGFNTRLNQGDGSFGNATTWDLLACGISDLDMADMDKDGALDVIIAEAAGCPSVPQPRAWIVRGNGDGTFVQPSGPVFLPSGLSNCLTHADFDNDGNPDLAIGQNSWLEVYRGHGDLTFEPKQIAPADFAPKRVLAGDFNADGFPDLASCNLGNIANDGIEESLSVLLGHGDGSFSAPQILAADLSWDLGSVMNLRSGDIDRDGDLDLAVVNFDSGDVSLYRNRGDGEFLPHTRIGGAQYASDAWLGDFTGDGVIDLALAGQPEPLKAPSIVMLTGLGNDPWIDLGSALAGAAGLPHLAAEGALVAASTLRWRADKLAPGALGAWVAGASALELPFASGVLVPAPQLLVPLVAGLDGSAQLSAQLGAALPAGAALLVQAWVLDAAGAAGFASTQGVVATAP